MNSGWHIERKHPERGLMIGLVALGALITGIREMRDKEQIACGTYITSSPTPPDAELTYTLDINGKRVGFRGDADYANDMTGGREYCVTFTRPFVDRHLTKEPWENHLEERRSA